MPTAANPFIDPAEIEAARGEMTGLAFTNLIGLFNHDSSIQGTTFSFDNLAKAIGLVGDDLKSLFDKIAKTEGMFAHFASGLALLGGGKYTDALTEFKESAKDASDATKLLFPLAPGGGIAGPGDLVQEPKEFRGLTFFGEVWY